MRASYTSFGHGCGIATTRSGRPAARACASSTSRRTPCIATRSTDSFTVVSNARDGTGPLRFSRCSAQALSLPELQDSRIFIAWCGCRMAEHLRVEGAGKVFGALNESRARHHEMVAGEEVDLRRRARPGRRRERPRRCALLCRCRLDQSLRAYFENDLRRAGEQCLGGRLDGFRLRCPRRRCHRPPHRACRA